MSNDDPIIESLPVKLGDARLEIKIDPKQVNETIAAAILSSGIGDLVKKAADEFLNNEETGYAALGLKKAVGDELTKIVIEMCSETELRDQMKQKIRDSITDGLIQGVVKASLERTLKSLQRGY